MAVHCLYQDFFRFLQSLGAGGDPWEAYREDYLQPHQDFFEAYWQTFPLVDGETLRDRVAQIRPGHYSALEHLLNQKKPETIVEQDLLRCQKVLPRFPEPDVYLLVGFFSADGFIVVVGGWPAIGIGLERFKDFRLLGLILAHEYCHYARRLALGSSSFETETLGQKLLAEGLSAVFSQRIYPQRPLTDHLLMSRHRLNWCQKNEASLESTARRELDTSRLVPMFFQRGKPGAGIPPRTGMYLGYRLVQRVLIESGEEAFEQLLGRQDITAVWSP